MANCCKCFEKLFKKTRNPPLSSQDYLLMVTNNDSNESNSSPQRPHPIVPSHSASNYSTFGLLTPPLLKEVSAQYIDMGEQYWREQIMDWIEDANDNDHTRTNTATNSISFNESQSSEWQKHETYIAFLYEQIKQENDYKHDQWDMIKHHLRDECQRDVFIHHTELRRSTHRRKTLSVSDPLASTPGKPNKKTSLSLGSNTQQSHPLQINMTRFKSNDSHPLTDFQEMNEMLKDKTQQDLKLQTRNENCCDDIKENKELFETCECLQRIRIVLNEYNQSLSIDSRDDALLQLIDAICVQDKYGHKQLFEDFCHVKVIHIEADNRVIKSRNGAYTPLYRGIGQYICTRLQDELKCADTKACRTWLRYYRNECEELKEDMSEKEFEDAMLRQECEKIHTYFYHSTIQYETEGYQTTAKEECQMDEQIEQIRQASLSIGSLPSLKQQSSFVPEGDHSSYVGEKEDGTWWSGVTPVRDGQNALDIYRVLVQNMGVFRWQNPHGFETGRNQEISHYKPQFKNIKEEVLQNEYYKLSVVSWNCTLRKSKVFFDSWARRKIKTKTESYFDDQITGYKDSWKAHQDINHKEIITLKLYTDFDKLQIQLKRCFRYEMLSDMFSLTPLRPQLSREQRTSSHVFRTKQQKLKQRLESFYHWRGNLLVVLNKFGTSLNGDNNMVLYHGVNSKMLIRATQTLAFSGPLSTTSSYHVARTFATVRGMVLTITSHFPRLNFCKAFDASTISDFPEEQEWLVGFMYCRVLKVQSRKYMSLEDLRRLPPASVIREEFFALHLFKEQMFSMGEHLQRILVQYLKVNRGECCDQTKQIKYKQQQKDFDDWPMEYMMQRLCGMQHKSTIAKGADMDRKKK
eukprot:338747_1